MGIVRAAKLLLLLCLIPSPVTGEVAVWAEWCWKHYPFASQYGPQTACWGDHWAGAEVTQDNCAMVLEPSCKLSGVDVRWRSGPDSPWHEDHQDCFGPCS